MKIKILQMYLVPGNDYRLQGYRFSEEQCFVQKLFL